MNIKRMSRTMFLALIASTMGSVFANNTRTERAMDWMHNAATTTANWTKDYWYVPAGIGVAASLMVLKNYYDKKKTEEAKKTKPGRRRIRRSAATAPARRYAIHRNRSGRNCRRGVCFR